MAARIAESSVLGDDDDFPQYESARGKTARKTKPTTRKKKAPLSAEAKQAAVDARKVIADAKKLTKKATADAKRAAAAAAKAALPPKKRAAPKKRPVKEVEKPTEDQPIAQSPTKRARGMSEPPLEQTEMVATEKFVPTEEHPVPPPGPPVIIHAKTPVGPKKERKKKAPAKRSAVDPAQAAASAEKGKKSASVAPLPKRIKRTVGKRSGLMTWSGQKRTHFMTMFSKELEKIMPMGNGVLVYSSIYRHIEDEKNLDNPDNDVRTVLHIVTHRDHTTGVSGSVKELPQWMRVEMAKSPAGVTVIDMQNSVDKCAPGIISAPEMELLKSIDANGANEIDSRMVLTYRVLNTPTMMLHPDLTHKQIVFRSKRGTTDTEIMIAIYSLCGGIPSDEIGEIKSLNLLSRRSFSEMCVMRADPFTMLNGCEDVPTLATQKCAIYEAHPPQGSSAVGKLHVPYAPSSERHAASIDICKIFTRTETKRRADEEEKKRPSKKDPNAPPEQRVPTIHRALDAIQHSGTENAPLPSNTALHVEDDDPVE